jgi:hypothetical protein
MPRRGAHHDTSIDDEPAPRSVAVLRTIGDATWEGIVVIVTVFDAALAPCGFDALTLYAQLSEPVHGTVADVPDVVAALVSAAPSIEASTSYVTGKPPVVADAAQTSETCDKVESTVETVSLAGALGATHNTTTPLATLVPTAFLA